MRAASIKWAAFHTQARACATGIPPLPTQTILFQCLGSRRGVGRGVGRALAKKLQKVEKEQKDKSRLRAPRSPVRVWCVWAHCSLFVLILRAYRGLSPARSRFAWRKVSSPPNQGLPGLENKNMAYHGLFSSPARGLWGLPNHKPSWPSAKDTPA